MELRVTRVASTFFPKKLIAARNILGNWVKGVEGDVAGEGGSSGEQMSVRKIKRKLVGLAVM